METEEAREQEETTSPHAPPTAFVGREEILDTIKRHLLKGQHVCLYGDRGIGKTAVVEDVVRWLREEKPGLRFIHMADEMTFKNLWFRWPEASTSWGSSGTRLSALMKSPTWNGGRSPSAPGR